MAAYTLKRFSNPELLKNIAPERLIAFLLPWRQYLAKRGLNLSKESTEIDCENLAQVLISPDGTVPTDMVDALYYVNETASDEDMDALLEMARTHVN